MNVDKQQWFGNVWVFVIKLSCSPDAYHTVTLGTCPVMLTCDGESS